MFLFNSIRNRNRLAQNAFALERLEDRCVMAAGFLRTNLISDIPGLAQFTDPALINPWGISVGPSGPLWFANNGTGTSTMDLSDTKSPKEFLDLVVTVPKSFEQPNKLGRPTGTVFHWGSEFVVSSGGNSGPSYFLFATEEGTISGWNPDVDLFRSFVGVDNSTMPGSGPIYTGLAVSSNAQGAFLYAANFRTGNIDVFDGNFQQVSWQGAFVDPKLPAGFTPFNVQDIGDEIYVTYTSRDLGRYDQGLGPGNGYVDVFDSNGQLLRRLISQGPLNAPWGVDVAPADFGEFSNSILVGNFADGRINAFNPKTGAFIGTMTDSLGEPIVIPGLWALMFADNRAAGEPATLYFAAGIGFEEHGLFGTLQTAANGLYPRAGSDTSLSAIPRSANPVNLDDDGYPLPPATGPTLQRTPQNLQASNITYLTVNNSSLAVAPVLLAAVNSTEPVTKGTTVQFAQPSTSNSHAEILSSYSQERVQPRGSDKSQNQWTASSPSEDFLAIDKALELIPFWESPVVEGKSNGVATNSPPNASVVSDAKLWTSLSNLALSAPLVGTARWEYSTNAPSYLEPPGQSALDGRFTQPKPPQIVAEAVALGSQDSPSNSTVSVATIFYAPEPVVLAVLLCAGVFFTRMRSRLPQVRPFEKIMSFWSRSTRRPSRTVAQSARANGPVDVMSSTCQMSPAVMNRLLQAGSDRS